MLSQTEGKIIMDLKHQLARVAGDRLQSVIVCGSRVLGKPHPDSDLDVAVIVRDWSPQVQEDILEAAYQVMWDHDFTPIISLTIVDSKNFAACLEKGFSFYRKVAQEGIAL